MIERRYKCDLCGDEHKLGDGLVPIHWENKTRFIKAPVQLQAEHHLCRPCLSCAAALWEKEFNHDPVPPV